MEILITYQDKDFKIKITEKITGKLQYDFLKIMKNIKASPKDIAIEAYWKNQADKKEEPAKDEIEHKINTVKDTFAMWDFVRLQQTTVSPEIFLNNYKINCGILQLIADKSCFDNDDLKEKFYEPIAVEGDLDEFWWLQNKEELEKALTFFREKIQ